jgi:hypothetical protein
LLPVLLVLLLLLLLLCTESCSKHTCAARTCITMSSAGKELSTLLLTVVGNAK